MSTPHWEHGYRCHGLWLDNARLGRVSIGPRGFFTGVYRWEASTKAGTIEGESRSLRAAKRHVERAVSAEVGR
jgi:hypothetical protein